VLTVYDLIPLRYPGHSTARARLLIRWMTWLALRTARQVIAISNFTRADFIAEFGLPAERIRAIPLAADPIFQPQPAEAVAAVRRKYSLPERFVLYVGSNKPHKNLTRLAEAWQVAQSGFPLPASSHPLPAPSLVIAGAQTEPASSAQPPAASAQRPTYLGPIPEADLPALYAAAAVFVFPSLYEGFGLPVLEAMACGAPVVCSNTSSLREITSPPIPLPAQGEGAGAALRFDPTDTRALADALVRVLTDPALAEALRGRGLRQAAHFTWEATAAATLALYREMVS
jgi:alpha-1,3-rhamnosyl/mannosyltransferase